MAVTRDLGAFVDAVCAANEEAIAAAAAAIARTAQAGGLLRPTGAGHSLAAVLETFFRAGGLAFVRPLWHPDLLPLNGARHATSLEREPGLGSQVAEEAGIAPEDTVVVFSNSGVNPYPVEIAERAAAAGATVVAITSKAAGDAAPRRAPLRVTDVAHIVIDTAVPPGDASWPPEAPVTAPLSSLATNAVWTLILREVYELAPDAPRWRSANMAGNDDHNDELMARYERRIPEL